MTRGGIAAALALIGVAPRDGQATTNASASRLAGADAGAALLVEQPAQRRHRTDGTAPTAPHRRGMRSSSRSRRPSTSRFLRWMNLAVGGNFLGNRDATTPFPGVMEVDFVRVHERRNRSTRVLPRGKGSLPWEPK